MELRFFINGVLYDNPINWDEIGVNLEYDPVNQITTISHQSNMDWQGDVYNLLFNEVENGDVCTLLDFELKAVIEGSLVTLFTGKIDITKCTFEERSRVVSVPIIDDSFGAKIENNKGAKVALDSVESKNGQPVSCNSVDLKVFVSSNGNYLAELRRAYTVYDAFEFLINWMSDNTIGFQSDFFDPSLTNDGANDYLLSGIDLRTGNDVSAPKFSFQELFDLMRRIRNVGMGFKDVNGTPTVIIEQIDFFRTNPDTFTLLDVNETQLSFEQNILYTTIKVGSDIVKPQDCSTVCNASNNVSYVGFETEFYTLSGECTSEAELTLTIDDPFIVDTNKIQEAVEFDSDTNDEKVFLIHKDPFNSVEALQSDPLGIGEYWYNEAYTNKQILLRYQDYVTGTLSLYSLNTGVNLFRATGSTTTGVLLPDQTPNFQTTPLGGSGFPCPAEVYDPQNRYNDTLYRFTPVDEGAYKMCMGVQGFDQATSPSGIEIIFNLVIEQYDSGGVLQNTYSSDDRGWLTRLSTPIFEEWESDWITMDSGDYLIFVVQYAQNFNPAVSQAEIVFGGSFMPQYIECCDSRVLIQDQQVNGGQKRQLAVTRFEYPIGIQDFRGFYDDTTQRIRVTSLDIDRTGYVNSLSYNFAKGQSEISIVSNG